MGSVISDQMTRSYKKFPSVYAFIVHCVEYEHHGNHSSANRVGPTRSGRVLPGRRPVRDRCGFGWMVMSFLAWIQPNSPPRSLLGLMVESPVGRCEHPFR